MKVSVRCRAGMWARGPAEVPLLESGAGEERHFQRSGCTGLGCSQASSSRWFLELSLQRVQTPAAGRACWRAASCAAARVAQSQASMPGSLQNPSAVTLLITLPGCRGGQLRAGTRQLAHLWHAGTAAGTRPTIRSCQDHSGAAFCLFPLLCLCQAASAWLYASCSFPKANGRSSRAAWSDLEAAPA